MGSFYFRYAFNHLIESEKDYIKDLKFCITKYIKAFDTEPLPDELVNRKDFIFSTYDEVHVFHNE